MRKWAGHGGGNGGADSCVLAVLCVSYLLETCQHILSCTQNFVCEEEAHNATQATYDGYLVGKDGYLVDKDQRGSIWDCDTLCRCVTHSTIWAYQVKCHATPLPGPMPLWRLGVDLCVLSLSLRVFLNAAPHPQSGVKCRDNHDNLNAPVSHLFICHHIYANTRRTYCSWRGVIECILQLTCFSGTENIYSSNFVRIGRAGFN